MTRDGDGAAAKDILSQLSKDDTLLEEIRKIALRGIISAQNRGRTVTPSHDDVEENTGSSSASSSSVTEWIEKNHSTIPSPSSSSTSTSNNGEKELAFTISRDSETYRSIISTACWYRDSVLIRSTFADQRIEINAEQNDINNQEKIKIPTENPTKINIDPSTAMAHPLLLSAAENYLRSIAAVDLLRPYATWAVSSDGPMFPISTQSMAQSIPLAQTSCDNAMRDNLLWVLKDEGWKEFAKSITAQYVDRSYRGGE
ncbi:hypothetical protein ACHAXH_000236 [Discostella pseudostelligera]